jgi:putative ABC transport system permease protein
MPKSLLKLSFKPRGITMTSKRKIPLAWLQLTREKGRFAVALAGIAFADILMLMQLGFRDALYDSNTRIHQLLNTDIVLLSPTSRNLNTLTTFPRRRLFQAASNPYVALAEPLYIRPGLWNSPDTHEETAILVIGFNPVNEVFNLPEVNKKLDVIRFPDTFMFDRATRGNYTDILTQLNHDKPVIKELLHRRIILQGTYEIGASFGPDGSVITSDQNFLRVFPQFQGGQVSLGRILLKSGSNIEQVVAELREQLPDDVKVLSKRGFVDFEKNYWQRSTAIGFIFTLGVGMGFTVGIIIVYQILYSDVTDHLPEYATLKAMGYRNAYLLGVVFQEALLLAILGYIPGNLISIVLYSLTRTATNLPLYMTVERTLQVLALTILMCMTSGVISMRKLQEADPADIF